VTIPKDKLTQYTKYYLGFVWRKTSETKVNLLFLTRPPKSEFGGNESEFGKNLRNDDLI